MWDFASAAVEMQQCTLHRKNREKFLRRLRLSNQPISNRFSLTVAQRSGALHRVATSPLHSVAQAGAAGPETMLVGSGGRSVKSTPNFLRNFPRVRSAGFRPITKRTNDLPPPSIRRSAAAPLDDGRRLRSERLPDGVKFQFDSLR